MQLPTSAGHSPFFHDIIFSDQRNPTKGDMVRKTTKGTGKKNAKISEKGIERSSRDVREAEKNVRKARLEAASQILRKVCSVESN